MKTTADLVRALDEGEVGVEEVIAQIRVQIAQMGEGIAHLARERDEAQQLLANANAIIGQKTDEAKKLIDEVERLRDAAQRGEAMRVAYNRERDAGFDISNALDRIADEFPEVK